MNPILRGFRRSESSAQATKTGIRCPDGPVYCVASGPLCRLQWEQADGGQLGAQPHLQESAWCYERKRGWYRPHGNFLSYLVADPEAPSGHRYLTKRWRDPYEGARGGVPYPGTSTSTTVAVCIWN